MKKGWIKCLCTIALIFVLREACANEIKIGFAAPLTGPQAMYGKDMHNGVVLAVEHFNASKVKIGGKEVRVVLLTEDDQADASVGTKIAQKMTDKKVKAMFGHYTSGVAIPAARIYKQAGIPQFSLSSAPEYTRQGFKTTFRMMPSDEQQAAALGAYAVKKLGAYAIAVIDDGTAYGKGAAIEFEKAVRAAGAKIVRREFTSDKAYDFKTILTNIKRAKPQVIFFGGTVVQAALLARQMGERRVTATLMGTEALRVNSFLSVAGKGAAGAIVVLGGRPVEKMPNGKVFQAYYHAQFAEPIDVYAPFSYDTAMFIFEAMKRAESTEPEKYLPYLYTLQAAGITSSRIAYDKNGDLRDKTVSIYKVTDDGKGWQLLDIISDG